MAPEETIGQIEDLYTACALEYEGFVVTIGGDQIGPAMWEQVVWLFHWQTLYDRSMPAELTESDREWLARQLRERAA